VNDKSKRDDGTFSRSDFRYDPMNDVYHCPGGKRLGTSGTVHEGKTLLYRASKFDCDAQFDGHIAKTSKDPDQITQSTPKHHVSEAHAAAFEPFLKHEITFAELQPGNYPNGFRVCCKVLSPSFKG
jgi:hypothetical protein